jgi:hypothetical protein
MASLFQEANNQAKAEGRGNWGQITIQDSQHTEAISSPVEIGL